MDVQGEDLETALAVDARSTPAVGEKVSGADALESDDSAPLDDAVRTYLAEIGKVPLLSEEQECAPGDDLRRGNLEMPRPLRALQARVRCMLLARDPSFIEESAAAWAPLLDLPSAELVTLFARLL